VSEAADEFFDLLEDAAAGGSADQLDDPHAVIRQQCADWVQAAQLLRFADKHEIWPGSEASAHEVAAALTRARSRLDQVESFLASAIALKAGTAEQAKKHEQAADDAWDDQADAERRSRAPRPEWQGAKERYAYWSLAIRDQRRRARQSRELADHVRCTYDLIKLAYDGLNETRRDLASRLSHFRWETHMEQ
jgi:hypothetical protein